MIRREDALNYHSHERPGKIEVRGTKAALTPRELRMAYLPGASWPSAAIAEDPAAVFRYTARGNLVGVITNGTAVPGLGNVGPLAAKPMQEGLAMLFKRLADIDVFDLELDTTDPDRFVETVQLLAPTFGGINLKDIRAREGLPIYERLCASMSIPVFHENLYSTAVVGVAALRNALDLVDKRIEEVRVVLCGAGTVGIGFARLLERLGVPGNHLLVYDVAGRLDSARDDLTEEQRRFAHREGPAQLPQGVAGADVLIGASAGGVFTREMISSMARYPIVLALATPEPEIGYEEARRLRQDVIVATSEATQPNAVLDLLSFPYLFRGALDVQATAISEGMMLAAAGALAELAREEAVEEVERAYANERFGFGPEYLLPKPIDPRILVRESAAVAEQAVVEGLAGKPLESEQYQERLTIRMGTGREMLRNMILQARQESMRVVFAEGTSETILRACAVLLEEKIAQPIVLGPEEQIHQTAERLGLDRHGIAVIDPARSPRRQDYADAYFHMRRRKGVIRAAAGHRLQQRDYFAAMMVHSGDADIMIGGLLTNYVDSLRTIIEVIGPAPGLRRISSYHLLLLPRDVVVMADCAVNINPEAEELAEIAVQAAGVARSLGLDPRVALLAFGNFGSVDHPIPRKVHQAVELARRQAPGLVIDGEMQLLTARDSRVRNEYFPFCELPADANVLIFPNLAAANMTSDSLHCMGNATSIGPILMGTRLPAHLLQYGSTAEYVVNLTAIAVVQAAAYHSNQS